MGDWWSSLSLLSKIFASLAIPTTIVLILQTILTLVGLGNDNDGDGIDSDGDGNVDMSLSEHEMLHEQGHDGHDHGEGMDGIRLFTLRSVIAFFSLGGWFGIFLNDTGASEVVAILGAVAVGTAGAVLIALFMKLAMRLQDKGNIVLENAIGKEATVYLTIPANMERTGKIMMELQGRFMELEALTKCEEALKTGKIVKVIGVISGNVLIVE